MSARRGPSRRAARMRTALLTAVAALVAAAGMLSQARAGDGYDTPFARTVRAETSRYRLVVWARTAGYVQSTDLIAGVGTMFTDHEDFNPSDLAHPTVLIFNEAGQLVACGYQFATGTPPGADFASVPKSAWYDIPRHVHYNFTVGAKTYFAQAAWDDDAQPTAPELIRRGLMPADGSLLFAFVHPSTQALLVWAWMPNEAGLFAGENSSQP